MSKESENNKELSAEASDAAGDRAEEDANTSEDSQDNVNTEASKAEAADSSNEDDKDAENTTKASVDKQNDEKVEDKKENDLKKDDTTDTKNSIEVKETKKEPKDKKKEDETKNGEAEDEEEEEEEEAPKSKVEEAPKKGGKKGVSLPSKTSEQTDSRKKSSKSKVDEDLESKEEKSDSSEGKGIQLGEIPRVDASISRFKNDDLKLLYRLLFKTPGKTALIAKSIKKFNGFGFKRDTEDYTKKLESTKKFELKQLKSICEMLDLEKKGTKDEIAERIMDFLIEPKDSGKQAGGGRPKRTAAVRANNRGYSSHDDSYSSDEKRASRGGGRGKGKRPNLKDETTSESDEEFHLSDTSETHSRPAKRKKNTPKHATDDELSEVDDPSSDESEGDRKKRKTKKTVNNKSKPKVTATPAKRGRKPLAESEKKPVTPKKPAGRKRALSEESEPAQDENASSSEDEPLIKKAKSPQPPTDEEIKKYVKEILDGANLEEITMKTVCKQVYAHYPDFDLAHKKDFIKSTVKSLIST